MVSKLAFRNNLIHFAAEDGLSEHRCSQPLDASP
jgi:hypothetical protein